MRHKDYRHLRHLEHLKHVEHHPRISVGTSDSHKRPVQPWKCQQLFHMADSNDIYWSTSSAQSSLRGWNFAYCRRLMVFTGQVFYFCSGSLQNFLLAGSDFTNRPVFYNILSF
jgi:hypothetical protein